MTSKRFRKLCYAEMSKLMKGNPKAGQVLKAVMKATPDWSKLENYQAAWDMLRTNIFQDMDCNRNCKLSER